MNKNRAGAGPERHVWDLLSAYIDNSLDKATHEEVRGHLEECADCRGDYIELRATQRMLKALPTVPPPRAFTLTEEAVAHKPGFLERLLAPRNSPRLATGSVLAFVLLVFVFAGNLFAASNSMAIPSSAYSAGWELSAGAAGPTAAPAQDTYSKLPAGAGQGSAPPAPASAPTPEAPVAAAPEAATNAGGGAAARPTTAPAQGDSMAGLPSSNPPSAAKSEPGATPSPAVGQGTTEDNYAPFVVQIPQTPTGASANSAAGAYQGPPNDGNLSVGDTTSPRTTGILPSTEHYAQPAASPSTRFEIVLVLEIGLALLGILMAAGAIVARRRG